MSEQAHVAGTSPDDLRVQVADVLHCDPAEIQDQDNLVLRGLGSLELMRLVTAWRRHGKSIDLGAVIADPTITAWHALLNPTQPTVRAV